MSDFIADREYMPGTIMQVGGDKEVTEARQIEKIIGITTRKSATKPGVVLIGRVECLVNGPINKGMKVGLGDHAGWGKAVIRPKPHFAIALADKTDDGLGLVEVIMVSSRI